MMIKKKIELIYLSTLAAILLMPLIGIAQVTVKGKVRYKIGSKPAAASIELLNRKGIKDTTDLAGNFSLTIKESRTDDTVVISSVGYHSLKLPLSVAKRKTDFMLVENVKKLEEVTVFNSQEVIGSKSETVGYYRSWNHENKGGEIGRIFTLPYDRFKIDKIRFKAGNTCDSCFVRLHIRYVEDGEPTDEIVDEPIELLINQLSLDSKISEFDLAPYDLTFFESEIFIGIELLDCGNANKENCTFSFAGTEKGDYFYKTGAKTKWKKSSDEYTIYLKLFLRF